MPHLAPEFMQIPLKKNILKVHNPKAFLPLFLEDVYAGTWEPLLTLQHCDPSVLCTYLHTDSS